MNSFVFICMVLHVNTHLSMCVLLCMLCMLLQDGVCLCVFVGKEIKCVCVCVLGFSESELVICMPVYLELSAGPGGYLDSLGLSP